MFIARGVIAANAMNSSPASTCACSSAVGRHRSRRPLVNSAITTGITSKFPLRLAELTLHLLVFSTGFDPSSQVTNIQLVQIPTCYHKKTKKSRVSAVQLFSSSSVTLSEHYKKHLKSLIQKKDISLSLNSDIFMHIFRAKK